MGLKWRGDAVFRDTQDAAEEALKQFDLRLEGAAKKELYKGHGVLTGTLRRSIHAANPSYLWSMDDTVPSDNSPERGGRAPEIEKRGLTLWGAVGSGLVYALAIHQGFGSFGGYHYITKPFESLRRSGAIVKDFRSEMRKKGYK
jgi:hypothetical protein